MKPLVEAARDVLVEAPEQDPLIKGVAYDSRRVEPGFLFFCVPGALNDGHDFASEAASRGAVALCVERPVDVDLPQVVVSSVRKAMARMSADFFDRPGDHLLLLGVTGTNGKTTTTFLLESILDAAGKKPGLIGTIATRVGDENRRGVRTTPESLDLQALLADMRAAGADSVAMEVTSHALVLDRVEALVYEAASFTNLSQDHLDFHSGMEDYFAAKRILFTREHARAGAVNVDDPYGRRLLDEAQIETIGFGTSEDALVRASDVRSGPWGSEFVIRAPENEMKIKTSLVGHFNVANCVAAAATALQAGIGPSAVERGIAALAAVPGRFEAVDEGQPFTVVVDYAHTPDSLDNVLRGAKGLAGNSRVICTFGCGGDRDRGKRPLMGAAAARLSDYVVVTSDNPRSEDPLAIIDSILEGVLAERADGPDAVLPDRHEAIAHVLAEARAGDVVVIAGKGHETGQEFADRTIPFDDREVARAALKELGWGEPS